MKSGGVALYVAHHGWPTKKILGFRWSKKATVTLETNVFGETFLSVFSNFLHFDESLPMKSYQFFKTFIRYEKRNTEKILTLFYLTGYFMTWKMVINHFFLSRSFCSQDIFSILPARSQRNFCFLMSG